MPLQRSHLTAIPLLIFISFVFQTSVYANGSTRAGRVDARHSATDTVPIKCAKTPEIERIISEAISLGAPIYNEGLHLACYRIYEWAAYKILYEYGRECKEVERILKTAIDKSHGDYSDTEKAWLMRQAFDKIIGEPTQMVNPEKAEPLRKG